MGCTDALVRRRKGLGDDVLELTVRRSLWRVARIEAFAASVELIQKFVEVLARTHSHGVHFGVLPSERFPRTAVELFAKGGWGNEPLHTWEISPTTDDATLVYICTLSMVHMKNKTRHSTMP
ncbi:unnamed protein product [Ascophyllum nodosum]